MVTISDVFNSAMSIMDELSQDGEAQTTNTEEYQHRAVAIVNIMVAEMRFYTGYTATNFIALESLDDYILGIDDTYALGIMPYGLAANLLVDENPTSASFYQQRYEELLNLYKRTQKGSIESIEDVYDSYNYY